MMLCPDCSSAFDENICASCGWELTLHHDLPLWLSNSDQSSQMFQNYLQNYESIGSDDLAESIQPHPYLELQTNYLLEYLGDVAGLKVCEVGVGKGHLMQRLLDSGVDHYTGVDICSAYLKTLLHRKNSSLHIANAENLPYNSAFDVIVAADILEHVFNVGDFLFSANRALKQGGKFVVKVPYLEDINSYSQKRGCKYDFVHLRNFSKDTLKIVLQGAGFEIQCIHYDGFWLSRTRSIMIKIGLLGKLIRKLLRADLVTNDFIPHPVNKVIACMLMKPAEITAVCVKTKEL